jgi:uncharacterized DUF497 family protein
MKQVMMLLLLTMPLPLLAQTRSQEYREQKRRNQQEPQEVITQQTTFKLRGYTDSTQLMFTKNATCKMECLTISEADVRQVLKDGLVNTERSELDQPEKKFAVEGAASESKTLRVVVVPKGNALLLITVIRIDKKENCDCRKKDNKPAATPEGNNGNQNG